MADGGLAAHLGRAAVGAVREEHARPGSIHPDARLAAGRGADFAALSEGPRAALDAYAEGVNAFIEEHRAGCSAWRSWSPGCGTDRRHGGYELEPWTALDSLAWQKVQAWQLGGNFDTEVFRMLADEQLGDLALTDQLFPAYWDTMPVITPSDAAAAAPRRHPRRRRHRHAPPERPRPPGATSRRSAAGS